MQIKFKFTACIFGREFIVGQQTKCRLHARNMFEFFVEQHYCSQDACCALFADIMFLERVMHA